MEYPDRKTRRSVVDDQYVYYTHCEYLELVATLGQYEDIGYTPLELVNILLDNELSKDSRSWDIDKIERWQGLKNRIKD